MPSLPRKSVKGANFKAWTVETLDKFVDYFNSNWIQSGKGISIRRTASGVIIELAKTPTVTPENITPSATGSVQDISATVSGGTASVSLSGSTSTVEFVGGENVTISGNTNGQIEINATGGGGGGATGLPYYETGLPPVEVATVYGPYAYDVWLIGHAGQNGLDGATLTLAINTNLTLILYDANFGSGSQQSLYVPVFVPIPAGNSFELYGSADFDLRIYQCTGQTPLADYTVTRASGITNGTLFYGLSERGDNTVSVDSSLDGTPLDFEGASVL